MNSEAVKSLTGMPSPVDEVLSRYAAKRKEPEQALEGALREQSEFQAIEAADKAQREATRSRSKAEGLRTEASIVRESPIARSLEKTEQQLMDDATFVPTKETAGDLAQLFALVNIAGFAMGAGGKRNAQAAMSAMNGMMEGYQKGRADLYKKEKDAFDTNLKALKTKSDILTRRLQEIAKLAQTDRAAADADADALFAEQGASFMKQYKEKYGLGAVIEYNKQRIQSIDKAVELETRLREREEARKAREEQARATAEYRRAMLARGPRESASGAGGAIQFRYNAAMTNAGNQLSMQVRNIAGVPLEASPPLLAETLTNPAKGVSDAVVQFLGGQITEPENRAVQQILGGMSRAITTIEASGRPSGATEASIKDFGKVAPKAGDKKINYYLFLAETKQVMEVLVKDLIASGGTPAQIDMATKARDEVGSVVTWTVDDINKILAKDRKRLVDNKTREMLKTSQDVRDFEPSAAAETSTAASPQTATFNNRKIVVGKNKEGKPAWVYADTGEEAK